MSSISVTKWYSKDNIKFEITNNSTESRVCHWFTKSEEVPFFSVPSPFVITPGETKVLIFKQRIDQQSPLGEGRKLCYTVRFKLTCNNITIFEDQHVCTCYSTTRFDVYLSSHLLPLSLQKKE
jgi:hypothetical protein